MNGYVDAMNGYVDAINWYVDAMNYVFDVIVLYGRVDDQGVSGQDHGIAFRYDGLLAS